jgi:hypothetical protein
MASPSVRLKFITNNVLAPAPGLRLLVLHGVTRSHISARPACQPGSCLSLHSRHCYKSSGSFGRAHLTPLLVRSNRYRSRTGRPFPEPFSTRAALSRYDPSYGGS